jgi:alpha-beta hydrolase superfamily lysophospholipase
MPDKFELVSDVLTDRDVPTLTVRRQGISEPPHVIVLHGLYSRKEEYLYELYLLAMAGFSATAIDMALHGDRPGSAGLADRMASDYLGAIQSVIYETVADICGLLDLWKVRVHSTGLFAISAGGLAAHAVSVVDKRIGAVAALITSPDWLTADPKMNLPSGSPVELVLC